MSNKREIVQSVVRGIRQDIEGYKQLKSMLQRQRDLMQRRDNHGLKYHNGHQTTLCGHLQQRARLRSEGLISLGFTGDAKGMEKLIAKLPVQASIQVKLLWENLLLLVKESQKVNEANGKLLAGQHEVISSLLNRDMPQNIDYGAPQTTP